MEPRLKFAFTIDEHYVSPEAHCIGGLKTSQYNYFHAFTITVPPPDDQ